MESRDGRSEDVSRSAAPLCCSEGEEQLNCYGPMSPTFKVSHKTRTDVSDSNIIKVKIVIIFKSASINTQSVTVIVVQMMAAASLICWY